MLAMALEIIVAIAAPAISSPMGKMKMGSRMMFSTPPRASPKLACAECPSERTRCASTWLSTLGTAPIQTVQIRYWLQNSYVSSSAPTAGSSTGLTSKMTMP